MFYVPDTTFISIIFSIVLPFVILYTLVCNRRAQARLAPPQPPQPQQQQLPQLLQLDEYEDEEDNEYDNQLDEDDLTLQRPDRVVSNWQVFSFLIKELVKYILVKTFRTQQTTYYDRMIALARKAEEEPVSGGVKLFEFTRLRCMKRAARTAILPSSFADSNHQFGVPKKRSGHRAVCNDENLWIWGGYCPVEEMSDDEWDTEDGNLDANGDDGNTPRSPLFPQVF